MLTNEETLDLAHSLRLAVGRLARRLRQRTLGRLTPSQLSVLASLGRHGPMSLGALADIEGVAASSISGIVTRLVGKGLVSRIRNPADRRSYLVELTEQGRAVLEEGRRERTALLARGLERLAPEERKTLVEAVAILDRLGEEEE